MDQKLGIWVWLGMYQFLLLMKFFFGLIQIFCIKSQSFDSFIYVKFIYSEKATKNLHRRFVLYSNGQIYGGDFGKFYGLLRIYEL